MNDLLGVGGFSAAERRILLDMIRAQDDLAAYGRAHVGSAILDMQDPLSRVIESQRLAETARNFTSDPGPLDLAACRAMGLERHQDWVSGGSVSAIAKAVEAANAANELQDARRVAINSAGVEAILRATEEHGAYAKEFARRAAGYADLASLTAQSPGIDHLFETIMQGHPTLAVRDVVSAALAIEAPWVSMNNPYGSLSGFAALCEIGQAMTHLAADHLGAAGRLRDLIGTWAPPPGFASWPEAQRLRAFMKSGLDEAVFEIPREAFEEVAEASGIVMRSPPGAYAPDKAPDKAESHIVVTIGSSRNLAAHDHVQSCECMIRTRVSTSMAARHGTNWPRHVIHGDVLKRLTALQDKPTQLTRSPSILDYASFGELLDIAMRKDVWALAFPNFIMSAEEFRVCVSRLIEVRNAVDHGRELDPVEYLWTLTETIRLYKAFGIPSYPARFE